MYFFPEAARAVARTAGFDLRDGPVFVEAAGPDRRSFDARLTWAIDLLLATPADRRWVAPHSAYLLSEDQLRAVATVAAEHGARVHVHACETMAELAAVRARHGRTPIEVLRDTGLLGPGTVLAHGVHLTPADIAVVAAAGATVSHCPASNQKLASGFAPIPELLAAGVPVALGTDGAASANDLDLWVAMRLAAYPLAARTGARHGRRGRHPGDGHDGWRHRRRRPRPRHDRRRHPRRPGGPGSDVAVAHAQLRRPLDCRVRGVARRCALGRGCRPGRRRRPPPGRRSTSPEPSAPCREIGATDPRRDRALTAPRPRRSGPYRTVGYGAIVGGNS